MRRARAAHCKFTYTEKKEILFYVTVTVNNAHSCWPLATATQLIGEEGVYNNSITYGFLSHHVACISAPRVGAFESSREPSLIRKRMLMVGSTADGGGSESDACAGFKLTASDFFIEASAPAAPGGPNEASGQGGFDISANLQLFTLSMPASAPGVCPEPFTDVSGGCSTGARLGEAGAADAEGAAGELLVRWSVPLSGTRSLHHAVNAVPFLTRVD
jgi:hypothetical protein